MPRLHSLPPATILALACAVAGCSAASDPTHDHGQPGSLRAAVFAHYDELAAAKALPHANGAGRADFSGVVRPFVQPGMTFDDAAALLKRNGFGVGAMPPRPITGEHWVDASRNDLLAGMQVANWVLVGRADLSCDFTPAAVTGDGAMTVGSVKCLLDVAML